MAPQTNARRPRLLLALPATRLVVSLGVSAFGSALTSFVLGVWVFRATGSYEAYAVIGFLTLLPILVVAPVAGYVADRFSKKTVLLSADFASVFTVVLLGGAVLASALTVPLVGVAVLILAISSEFRYTATGAVVFALVPKEELPRINSLQQMFRGVSIMGGPVLAAIIFDEFGLVPILAMDALSFVVNVAVVLTLAMPRTRASFEGATKQSFWTEMTEGLRWVRADKSLLSLLLFFLVATSGLSLFNVALGPFVLSYGTNADLGIITGLVGVGLFTGGVVFAGIQLHGHVERAMILSVVGLATCFIIFGLSSEVLVHRALAVVVGFCVATLASTNQTIWQVRTPAHLQGKVIAVRSVATYALSPLAVLVSIPLVAGIVEPFLRRHVMLALLWGGSGQQAAIGFVISAIGLMLMLLLLVYFRIACTAPPDKEVADGAGP